MRQGEAQMIAAAGLRRFCRDQPCGPTRLVSAQKIKDRWLVDFDGQKQKFTVIVEDDGNSTVTAWDKGAAKP